VEKEKQAAPSLLLNVLMLLADLNVSGKRPEVVDMVLPFFIDSLEEGDASLSGLLRLRLQLLDAVARMASLGFEKSYREAVVLMTKSCLSKLAAVGSAESKTTVPEAITERVVACSCCFGSYYNISLSLRISYPPTAHMSGADFLGPLLPAVAEICSDSDPTVDVEPSLLKLFRNLWFYVALFGLAPPLQNHHGMTKSVSTTLNSVCSLGSVALQAVSGPYMWSADWFSAVQRISQGTPPLVVSSMELLEDELELNALHNPGSPRGSGNEKAAVSQRIALSTALGGCIKVSTMSTISGVKSTYLLAVAILEITQFCSNGGILSVPSSTASRTAFSCVFEYLKSPGLKPAVSQCLTAIVQRAFETAVAWLLLQRLLAKLDSANVATSNYVQSGTAFAAHLNSWIVDSGANRHMTGSSKGIQSYSSCLKGDNVKYRQWFFNTYL
ncbi:phosphatidylinositol 4-kinase alpha 1, partial [Nicotiana attenuata]